MIGWIKEKYQLWKANREFKKKMRDKKDPYTYD